MAGDRRDRKFFLSRAGSSPFEATKALHNALQGSDRGLTRAQRAEYEAHTEREAARLGAGYDFVFVHDPQLAPLRALGGAGDARWVWRCHIDTAQPNPEAWAYLRPFVGAYEAAIFTLSEFLPPELSVPRGTSCRRRSIR